MAHKDASGDPYVMELCPMVLAYTCGIESHIDNEMLLRKDGSEFPAEYIANPLKRNNEIIGAVITMRDTAEKKKTESALRSSEEQYRSLFESSRDAVLIINETGVVLNANDTAVKMFGYRTNSELIGLNPMDTSPEVQVEGLASSELAKVRLQQAINEGGSFFEWKHIRKDGSEFLVEITLTSIMYRGRRAIQAVLRDITARKEMEKKLRQSLSEVESIFENSTVGILYLSGFERKIHRVNRRFLELMGGYTEDEVAGGCVSMFHPTKEHFEKFGKYYTENLVKGETVKTEIPLKRKDGTVIKCAISGKAVDPPDMSKGVIWVVDDISRYEKK
jgi:PAS domain S-box-containing protein